MSKFVKPASWAVVLSLASAGCYGRGGRLVGAMAWTAIVTTAIITSRPPPPPAVVVYPPAPRSGYSWQPGYWTVDDGEWIWVEGRWVRNHPGYRWEPPRWVEDPGGQWRLIPGAWVSEPPPPPGE